MPGLFFTLPARADAAGLAREALADLRDVSEELLGDLALLTSEVVTNALMHAELRPDDHVAVTVDRTHDAVRVRVCDPRRSDAAPGLRRPGPERPGGWGLFIVDQLARRWGVEHNDHTCVWFDLSAAPRTG